VLFVALCGVRLVRLLLFFCDFPEGFEVFFVALDYFFVFY